MKGGKAYSAQVKACLEEENNGDDKLASLTAREFEILQNVAKGMRNKQVADKLFISEATVKVHMKSLLKITECKITSSSDINLLRLII